MTHRWSSAQEHNYERSTKRGARFFFKQRTNLGMSIDLPAGWSVGQVTPSLFHVRPGDAFERIMAS